MPSINLRQLRDTRQLKRWLKTGQTVELRERRQALAVEAAFASDCRAGVWVPMALPDMAWQVCSGLAWQFGPRLPICTLDSLHVAAALVLHADRFWTFDQRQARLARAAGLTTVGIV